MKIFLNIIISSILLSQEYKIQFSHIPIGQGIIQNDSIGFISDAAETITLTAGTNVSLEGTMTIAQSNTKKFLAVVTNASSAAVTIYSLGTSLH